MSAFNGKTHNLQTQKYDASMTSPVKKIFIFYTEWILVSSWTFSKTFVEI